MKNSLKDIIASGIIVTVISIMTFLGIYGNSFFRDFTVIFDGGYRIFTGIHPFVDFALFPIPVPFYMQAVFNSIFGPNLIAMGFHSIVLSSILSIIFYLMIKRDFNRFVSVIFSIAFFYSFIGIIAFPWYNQIAYFFFLLNFFLIYFKIGNITKKNKLFIFSAILTLLTLFSKTEVGFMHFILVSAYFLIFYKQEIKRLTYYFFLPTIFLFVLIRKIIGVLSQKSFELTSGILMNKLGSLFSVYTVDFLIYSFNFYFLIFLLYLPFTDFKRYIYLNERSKKIFVLILLLNIFVISISLTGGHPIQTKILALPLNLFLAYLLVKGIPKEGKIKVKKNLLKIVAIVFIFLIILMQFNSITNYQTTIFKSPTKQIHNIFFLEETAYAREDFGCYKGMLYEKEHLIGLKRIRQYIKENDKDFVVFGGYSFLYCDYKTDPPKDLPLWVHEGVTFDKKENFYKVKEYFNKSKPKLIIEQLYAPNETREEFGEFLIEIGYEKTGEVSSELSPIVLYTFKKE